MTDRLDIIEKAIMLLVRENPITVGCPKNLAQFVDLKEEEDRIAIEQAFYIARKLND